MIVCLTWVASLYLFRSLVPLIKVASKLGAVVHSRIKHGEIVHSHVGCTQGRLYSFSLLHCLFNLKSEICRLIISRSPNRSRRGCVPRFKYIHRLSSRHVNRISIKMDSISFCENFAHLESSGFVLSIEQRATLKTSLPILKSQHKFNRLLLWGNIKGIRKDYFIAKGTGMDEIKDRKYLYR